MNLAEQQQALLETLFGTSPSGATENIAACALSMRARGLKAYQSHGHLLAERVLTAAFPVLTQLVGSDSMAALARAFWHAQPPLQGDLAAWGAALPAFVQASAQLQDEPYLADVARVEWALHRAAPLADVPAQLDSLALLTTHDPDTLLLVLAPGVYGLASAWPVASMLAAHRDGSPTLPEVGELLRANVGEAVLVWRKGWQPQVRQAQAGELACLQALLAGQALEQALASAPTLNFETWFPQAVHSGLVLGVTPVVE
jgi:hypothetical protein